MSIKLLQRVIEEGHRGFAIKSVLGGGETVEQWSIPKDLESDIRKYLAKFERNKSVIRTKKGQHRIECIYSYIVDYKKIHGYSPSVRDIKSNCEISSTSVVSFYLDKLQEDGRIKRTPSVARGIVVVQKGDE